MKRLILIISFISIVTSNSFAQETKVKTEVLSKTSQSWDGTSLPNYPKGQPEITISRITIPVGFQLPVHKHPIPLGGVILEGELTVIREDGKRHIVKTGESIVELVNTWHFGKNESDAPVVIIAFYAGVKDEPITVLKDN